MKKNENLVIFRGEIVDKTKKTSASIVENGNKEAVPVTVDSAGAKGGARLFPTK